MYTREFETWFREVLQVWERGISNRPTSQDPGGYTVNGITWNTWKNQGAKLLGKPATVDALSKITWEDVKKLAYLLYWVPGRVELVKRPDMQIIYADSLWHGGGIKSMGYPNLSALNADKTVSIDTVINRRMAYLKSLKNWEPNKNGWTNRLNSLKNAAFSLFQKISPIVILFIIAALYVYLLK
jgi:lysozyme family protein